MSPAISQTAALRLRAGYSNNSTALAKYEPDFGVKAAFCSTYTDLLLGECGPVVGYTELLQKVSASGRAILSDRGGAGKTVFLRRLMKFAVNEGFHCMFLDLSQWTDADTEALKKINTDRLGIFDYLLRRFSEAEFDAALLEGIGPDQQKLIIFDGLNETPGLMAERVLGACDIAANTYPSLQVIASDRLIRRELEFEPRWFFFHILDLSRDDIASILGRSNFTEAEFELMRSPFFLDQQRKGNLGDSRIQTIVNYISEHGSVSEADLNGLSEAAFQIYRSVGSRTFPRSCLSEGVNAEVISGLLQAQILIERDDNQLCFAHHWTHDCLASLYVSKNQHLWGPEERNVTLDALTFRRNSFDAVGFVLQSLDTPSSASFLQAVYDWNPYAAGYALNDVDSGYEGNVAKDVRTIVLSMLALRKLDRQLSTAKKAADALNLFRDNLAIELRNVSSTEELIGFVSQIDYHSQQFEEWKAIFCQPTDGKSTSGLVAELSSANSINGWTASNVIKRLKIGDSEVSSLLEMLQSDRSVVRWRAAHALGAVAKADVVAALLNLLTKDKDTDVQFGCIRSLIEIASVNRKLASSVIEGISPLLGKINEQPAIAGELENSLFVQNGKAYSGWEEDGIQIFNQLIDKAQSISEIERWSNAASRLRIYGRQLQTEAV